MILVRHIIQLPPQYVWLSEVGMDSNFRQRYPVCSHYDRCLHDPKPAGSLTEEFVDDTEKRTFPVCG